MEYKNVKIAVYVPVEAVPQIKEALATVGAGHIGNYDYCSFSIEGKGNFRGLDGTNLYIGKAGEIEEVAEVRIETICAKEKWEAVVAKIKEVHPYEEPAIDVYPLLYPN